MQRLQSGWLSAQKILKVVCWCVKHTGVWGLGHPLLPPGSYSRTTKIPSSGFSGITQQTVVQRSLGRLDLFCCPWSKIATSYLFFHIIWKVLCKLCCHNHLAHELSFCHKKWILCLSPPYVYSRLFRRPHHGVRLACPCLSVCYDAHIVAIHTRSDDRFSVL